MEKKTVHMPICPLVFVFTRPSLSSRTTTLIVIYSRCQDASVCGFLSLTQTRQGQGCDGTPKHVRLFRGVKYARFVFPCICVFAFLALRGSLNTSRSAGVIDDLNWRANEFHSLRRNELALKTLNAREAELMFEEVTLPGLAKNSCIFRGAIHF